MNPKPTLTNPGPRGGFRIIGFLERNLPVWAFRWLLSTGTFICLLIMKETRGYSREFLRRIYGRDPRLGEQYRHLRTFMDCFVLKLQAGRGKFPEFTFAPDAHQESFLELCQSDGPVLFGTFHVGYADLMGCMLKDLNRRISMVRLRVNNSMDTEILGKAFAGTMNFIWINDPTEFIFGVKNAIEDGKSIALQCDRIEFGGKLGHFDFLGARRAFPVSIYYLANLFRLPVVICYTGHRQPDGRIPVYTSPVYHPGEKRRESLDRGAAHFQSVLDGLECHVHKHPELWFNFVPLNPEEGNEAPSPDNPRLRRFLPPNATVEHTRDALHARFVLPRMPFYCQGHMPGNPIVPAYAQMAWIHELVRMWIPGRPPALEYKRLKFLHPIRPGDEVRVEIIRAAGLARLSFTCRDQAVTRGGIRLPERGMGEGCSRP